MLGARFGIKMERLIRGQWYVKFVIIRLGVQVGIVLKLLFVFGARQLLVRGKVNNIRLVVRLVRRSIREWLGV